MSSCLCVCLTKAQCVCVPSAYVWLTDWLTDCLHVDWPSDMHTRTHIHTHLHRSVRTENYLPLDDAVLLLGVYSPWRTALNWTFVDDDLSNHLPSLSFSLSLFQLLCLQIGSLGNIYVVVTRWWLWLEQHCTALSWPVTSLSEAQEQVRQQKKEVVEKKRKERKKKRNSGKASSDQTPRLTFADNNSRLDWKEKRREHYRCSMVVVRSTKTDCFFCFFFFLEIQKGDGNDGQSPLMCACVITLKRWSVWKRFWLIVLTRGRIRQRRRLWQRWRSTAEKMIIYDCPPRDVTVRSYLLTPHTHWMLISQWFVVAFW